MGEPRETREPAAVRESRAARLRKARADAGFPEASKAAKKFGWGVSTYLAHENNQNSFNLVVSKKYAKAFRVSWIWLFSGEGEQGLLAAPIVGLAGANPDGSVLYSDVDGELGEAPMPPGGDERTVAVEVRGDSMRGVAEDGWLVFFSDRHDPPTDDLLGEVCVVGLDDGRVLIKKLLRGRKRHHFDLESLTAPMLYDVKVAWAAPVIAIVPRRQAQRLVTR